MSHSFPTRRSSDLRAFGWFNVAFGLFVEIGRRQLSQTNNRTGSFVAVTWLTHVCGFLFELFLKPAGTTNLPSVLWHASFAILYLIGYSLTYKGIRLEGRELPEYHTMAPCTSCLLSRSSNCCSQHFCDVCKYMFRMDQCNGQIGRASCRERV